MEKRNMPTIREIVRWALIVGGVVVGLKVVTDMKDLFFSLFIAYIFMSAAKQPVASLQERKVPRSLAVFLVYAAWVLFFIFIISTLIPLFITETTLFAKYFPSILKTIEKSFPSLRSALDTSSILPSATNQFINVIKALVGNVFIFISTVFFSVYFTLEENFLKKTIHPFLTKEQLAVFEKVEERVEKRLGSWLIGEFFLMFAVGLFSFILFSLAGVHYALPLALIAGLLEVVPNIGPTLAAVPAILVAYSQAQVLGGIALGISILVQQVENNILVPLVMSKVTGLHPVVTLIVLLVGGRYGGVLGVLLAIPVTLVVETVISEIHKLTSK
jgi:predicted PurR-regulated permease PerM